MLCDGIVFDIKTETCRQAFTNPFAFTAVGNKAATQIAPNQVIAQIQLKNTSILIEYNKDASNVNILTEF